MARGYGYAESPEPSNYEDLKDSWPGDFFVPFVPSLLMDVPNGNYQVTLTLGNSEKATVTTVKEGLGHLRLYEWRTEAGQIVTKSFAVHINDGQLKLAFGGESPGVQFVDVKREASIPTIYLAGDSTVTDQPSGQFPCSGWGQMFGLFVNNGAALANHARCGRSTKSFVDEDRLNRIAKTLRQGDYLLVQFAHNDEKDNEGGTKPFTTYQTYLRRYIELARQKKAYPVLITSMHRRFFENGTIRNTHGDYIEAMRLLALREKVPFVDLAALSKAYYEQLGEERSKQVFLWAKPGEWTNLPEGSEDNTHFSEKGAVEIARLVAKGIQKDRVDPLQRYVHAGIETGISERLI